MLRGLVKPGESTTSGRLWARPAGAASRIAWVRVVLSTSSGPSAGLSASRSSSSDSVGVMYWAGCPLDAFVGYHSEIMSSRLSTVGSQGSGRESSRRWTEVVPTACRPVGANRDSAGDGSVAERAVGVASARAGAPRQAEATETAARSAAVPAGRLGRGARAVRGDMGRTGPFGGRRSWRNGRGETVVVRRVCLGFSGQHRATPGTGFGARRGQPARWPGLGGCPVVCWSPRLTRPVS